MEYLRLGLRQKNSSVFKMIVQLRNVKRVLEICKAELTEKKT